MQQENRKAAMIQTQQLAKDNRLKAAADRAAKKNQPQTHRLSIMTWNVRGMETAMRRSKILEEIEEVNRGKFKLGKEIDIVNFIETHSDFI
jgi:hypothetical protein